MNNALTVFNYKNKNVRTTLIDDEPWFVAKDIAEVLGYTWNGSQRIAHIPEEWRGVTSVVTPFGKQEMAVISERGLYFFLGRSDKSTALPFQKWFAGDVMPQIRKTGSYNKTPTTMLEALELAIDTEKKRLLLEQQNAMLQIKLDENKEYYTVKRVAALNNILWKTLDWRGLKNTSQAMEQEIQKAFDANYENVNAYHISVWKHEYPNLMYD
jgi:prophage antirepressor-like protein